MALGELDKVEKRGIEDLKGLASWCSALVEKKLEAPARKVFNFIKMETSFIKMLEKEHESNFEKEGSNSENNQDSQSSSTADKAEGGNGKVGNANYKKTIWKEQEKSGEFIAKLMEEIETKLSKLKNLKPVEKTSAEWKSKVRKHFEDQVKDQPEEFRIKLLSLVEEFAEIFWETGMEFPTIKDAVTGKPIVADIEGAEKLPRRVVSPFRTSYADSLRMNFLIEEAVLEGKLKRVPPGAPPLFQSPAFLAERKGHLTKRLVVDYRVLNSVLPSAAYRMPSADKIWKNLDKKTFYGLTDLALGYNQVALSERASQALAIVVEGGTFIPTRLPLGPSFAPSLFQSITFSLFDGISSSLGVFIDDVVWGGDTEEEFLEITRKVFERCRATGMALSLKKTVLATPSATVLGFKISKAGRFPDPSKVEQLKNWPIPGSREELVSFLAFANYLREFFPNFVRLRGPLLLFLSSKKKFSEFSEVLPSFLALRTAIAEDVPIVALDWEAAINWRKSGRPVVVTLDASEFGKGFVVCQASRKFGPLRPVVVKGKSFSAAERKWSTFERELAALKLFLDEGWREVEGLEYFLLSDHKNIGEAIDSIIANQRVASKIVRWFENNRKKLSSCHRFHVSGVCNILADAVSRSPSVVSVEIPGEIAENLPRSVRQVIQWLFVPEAGKEPKNVGNVDDEELEEKYWDCEDVETFGPSKIGALMNSKNLKTPERLDVYSVRACIRCRADHRSESYLVQGSIDQDKTEGWFTFGRKKKEEIIYKPVKKNRQDCRDEAVKFFRSHFQTGLKSSDHPKRFRVIDDEKLDEFDTSSAADDDEDPAEFKLAVDLWDPRKDVLLSELETICPNAVGPGMNGFWNCGCSDGFFGLEHLSAPIEDQGDAIQNNEMKQNQNNVILNDEIEQDQDDTIQEYETKIDSEKITDEQKQIDVIVEYLEAGGEVIGDEEDDLLADEESGDMIPEVHFRVPQHLCSDLLQKTSLKFIPYSELKFQRVNAEEDFIKIPDEIARCYLILFNKPSRKWAMKCGKPFEFGFIGEVLEKESGSFGFWIGVEKGENCLESRQLIGLDTGEEMEKKLRLIALQEKDPFALGLRQLVEAFNRGGEISTDVIESVESLKEKRRILLEFRDSGRTYRIASDGVLICFCFSVGDWMTYIPSGVWGLDLFAVSLRQYLFNLAEEATCNGGVSMIYRYLRRSGLYWDGQFNDIKKMIKKNLANWDGWYSGQPIRTMLQTGEQDNYFRSCYFFDFCGPWEVGAGGVCQLFTVCDGASGFFWAFACVDKSTAEAIRCLRIVFQDFGPCKLLRSDRGFHKLGEFLREVKREHKQIVEYKQGTSYHPCGQHSIERTHTHCRRYFTKKGGNWWEHVGGLVLHLRRDVVGPGGVTPLEFLGISQSDYFPICRPLCPSSDSGDVLDQQVRSLREKRLAQFQQRQADKEKRVGERSRIFGVSNPPVVGDIVRVLLPNAERKMKKKLFGNCRPELFEVERVGRRVVYLRDRKGKNVFSFHNPVSFDNIYRTDLKREDFLREDMAVVRQGKRLDLVKIDLWDDSCKEVEVSTGIEKTKRFSEVIKKVVVILDKD